MLQSSRPCECESHDSLRPTGADIPKPLSASWSSFKLHRLQDDIICILHPESPLLK